LTRDVSPPPDAPEGEAASREAMEAMTSLLNESPVYRHLNMRVLQAAGGRSQVRLAVGEDHKNLYGTVHGGMLAALMDSACGVAQATRLREGESLVTLDLSIHYLRPVLGGPLTAEGLVVHRGRRTGVAEASVLDETGRVVARGTCTHFVRKNDEIAFDEPSGCLADPDNGRRS